MTSIYVLCGLTDFALSVVLVASTVSFEDLKVSSECSTIVSPLTAFCSHTK